jgi:hypothetical protein
MITMFTKVYGRGSCVLMSTSFKAKKEPINGDPIRREHASATGSLSGSEMGLYQPASSA